MRYKFEVTQLTGGKWIANVFLTTKSAVSPLYLLSETGDSPTSVVEKAENAAGMLLEKFLGFHEEPK